VLSRVLKLMAEYCTYVRIVLFELNIRLPFVNSEVVTKVHLWPNISIFDIKYELPYRPEHLLPPACGKMCEKIRTHIYWSVLQYVQYGMTMWKNYKILIAKTVLMTM
jgi:hypothetical protein